MSGKERILATWPYKPDDAILEPLLNAELERLRAVQKLLGRITFVSSSFAKHRMFPNWKGNIFIGANFYANGLRVPERFRLTSDAISKTYSLIVTS